MNEDKNKFLRESLRKSLSRAETVYPETGIDLNELGKAAPIRIYRRRWLVLLLFVMFAFGTKIQWLQYTVILDVVVKFFNVSPMVVKATAMVYNVFFIILLFPLNWVIHKQGIRSVCVLGSASVCLGTWIKYFAISPDQFSLILVGQCLVGTWEVACTSIPSTLAANWFGPNEVATATALGVSGTVFGIALSAILGPIIIKNHSESGDIGKDLNHYTLPLGFYCTCTLFLVFFFFTEGPKLPPSRSRALQKLCVGEELEFLKKIRRLLNNRNYVILWNAHGFIVGQMICVIMSLNTLYMQHFKNGEQDIGRIGVLIILSGYCGSIIFARILDRFKTFKLILIILCVANTLATLLLVISVYFEIRWAVYASIAIYGFFTHGYYTTSFETCAEITYPEPVTFCVAILNLSNQIYCAIFVACLDRLVLIYSDIAAYAFLVVISITGFILQCITRDERKRQVAGKLHQEMSIHLELNE